MTDSFYSDFEAKHRGSRELIKTRLTVYQPFLEAIRSSCPTAKAVDLGCGRGEWLEYVTALGFTATGVDIDEGMLSACNRLGLTVEQKDLLDHLQSLESESVSLISAFHVVEHIPFDDLRALVKESLRALKPGGLLIMETPNPENVVVASHMFYMDPTHKNPLPPQLLAFVTDHEGFKRTKILRVQESKDLFEKQRVSLKDVFFGVSPDYAIVAQKDATPEELKKFTPLFQKNYGLSLDDLLNRWDTGYAKLQQPASRKERGKPASEDNEHVIELLLVKMQELEAKSIELERVRIHSHHLHKDKLAAETRAKNLNQQILAIRQSTSWRVTWPLRLLKPVLQHLFLFDKRRLRIMANTMRKIARHTLAKTIWLVRKNKSLEAVALNGLSRYPVLAEHLRAFAINQRLHTSHRRASQSTMEAPLADSSMTPRAKQLYSALKLAIENNKNQE